MKKETLSELEEDLLSNSKKNTIIDYVKKRIKSLEASNEDQSLLLKKGFESLELVINKFQET